MDNERRFYTYAYLREDGTPYYIGKGTGCRAYANSGRKAKVPADRSRILFLKRHLTEEEAFRHERYMIAVLGRKDLGTGTLWNFTDGGEGVSGLCHTDESRLRMSSTKKDKSESEKAATSEKLSVAAKAYFSSLTEAEKLRLSAKVSEVHSSRTEEEKAEINSKRSRTLLNKSPEEKAETALKKREARLGKEEEFSLRMTEVHRNRPKEEKEEISRRISESLSKLKWYVNPLGETARSQNPPGPEWVSGRKWKTPTLSLET